MKTFAKPLRPKNAGQPSQEPSLFHNSANVQYVQHFPDMLGQNKHKHDGLYD